MSHKHFSSLPAAILSYGPDIFFSWCNSLEWPVISVKAFLLFPAKHLEVLFLISSIEILFPAMYKLGNLCSSKAQNKT